MRMCFVLLLAVALAPMARAATVRVTMSGIVKSIEVTEGPVLGLDSKEHFEDDTPFVLVYIFDDSKGEATVQTDEGGDITQSGQRTAHSNSPGISAVLHIGDASWDFGESVYSEVNLVAKQGTKGYTIRYRTGDKDNWVMSTVSPKEAGSWTTSGDWRQSYHADQLAANEIPFSADNGTVSAAGTLIASSIAVDGVDLGGQALSIRAVGQDTSKGSWTGEWRLAKPSPRGGCIIERVTRTVVGILPPNETPITPYSTTYWLAWRVAPGMTTAIPAIDSFENTYPSGSSGTVTLAGTARFYQNTAIPASFTAGGVAVAGSQLSSPTDPSLPTIRATQPVTRKAEIAF